MKRIIVCCVLTLGLLVVCEPHVRQYLTDAARSLAGRQAAVRTGTDDTPSFSQQIGSHAVKDMLDVTLYYRFEKTKLLGAQRAQLDIRREETVATSIVQRLVNGPDVSHEKLAGVFPPGTEVISVTGEDTTAFVTLSMDFLGRPEGAPPDWEDSRVWQEEATLRRKMAVQSIVLALTEGGRYQRVQMYVAQSDDDIPQRIPMAYFDLSTEDASLVLAASPRDEAAMLTPYHAMEMILDAWKAKDYPMLYTLLAPSQEEEMPTLSIFEAEMKKRDISLLSYAASEGTVSLDGKTATVVVDAQIRSSEGGDAQIIRESVPLIRVDDNWAIAENTLLSLMIRD